MLKRLIYMAAGVIPVLLLSSSLVRAADIGGAPVKVIPTPTTYSTVYSETFVASPFWYGSPQTIIITPIVPYNSVTVTTGNTRFELIDPAPYSTYGFRGGIYGSGGQSILIQPGAVYRRPHYYHGNRHRS